MKSAPSHLEKGTSCSLLTFLTATGHSNSLVSCDFYIDSLRSQSVALLLVEVLFLSWNERVGFDSRSASSDWPRKRPSYNLLSVIHFQGQNTTIYAAIDRAMVLDTLNIGTPVPCLYKDDVRPNWWNSYDVGSVSNYPYRKQVLGEDINPPAVVNPVKTSSS